MLMPVALLCRVATVIVVLGWVFELGGPA